MTFRHVGIIVFKVLNEFLIINQKNIFILKNAIFI